LGGAAAQNNPTIPPFSLIPYSHYCSKLLTILE
jgi:hypothetical protein